MTMRIIPANFFDDVTDLAVSPAAVSSMPATSLQNSNRDEVWRSTSLAPQVFTFSFGGNARPIDSWGIWPGNLIGAKIRVELFVGVASVYDSGTLECFTPTGEVWGTFLWGGPPWGVELADRTARSAPLVKFITEVIADNGRITITNGGAVDTEYLEASRFWLGQSVLAPYTARHGLAPQFVDLSEQSRSPGAVLRVQTNAKHRRMAFDTVFETEADRFAWSQILGFCGTSREVVISLLPTDGTTLGRELTLRGYIEALNPTVFANPNFHTLQLAFTES